MAFTLKELTLYLRDGVLAPHLGLYRHADAALNKPAFSVGPHTTPGYTTVGLEAVLDRVPRDRGRPLLGDGSLVQREWVVLLKSWGAPDALSAAVTAMQRAFPQMPAPVYVPETDTTIATVECRVPDLIHIEGM